MAASARQTLVLLAAVLATLAGGLWGLPTLAPPAAERAPAIAPGTSALVLSPARFDAFVTAFKAEAAAQGVGAAILDRAFDRMTADAEVMDLAATQPEYMKPAGDYLAALVSDVRIDTGRDKAVEMVAVLAAIEAAHGVDRNIVLAIWGVESNFGVAMGTRSVLRSLATLAAFDSRRPDFWRAELLAAMRILQSGAVAGGQLSGSWAGAMGHTQFMPSTYMLHAVDFDGDGRRDIWNSIPDALGSTASYLKASGWTAGAPWGFEVRLPSGFDYGLTNPAVMSSWTEWQALGVTPAQETRSPISGQMPALQLILPAGASGPAFLVGDNFRALLRYNNSVSYALAVGHLADRIAGGAPFVGTWPAGDRGLGKADREEIQRRLAALGFDAGVADGVIGNGTKAAIRLFQKTRALPQDGHADLALLERLRQEGSR